MTSHARDVRTAFLCRVDRAGFAGALALIGACSSPANPDVPTADASSDGGETSDASDSTIGEAADRPETSTGPSPALTTSARNVRFVVREHMLAGVEMQLSGEPFAESQGRDLKNYSRDYIPPDIYFDPSPTSTGPVTDVAGFSSAIDSYEYSKQPMNGLSFEFGAGTSLAYGSALNAAAVTGAAACAVLRDRVQHLGAASHATSRFVHADVTPTNPLGWPGIWPTLAPFVSFDPTIEGTNSVAGRCAITSDDDPGATGKLISNDYECDATSLHLTNRAAQIDSAISPGASGWAGWKSALWILNYLQVMHDSNEAPVKSVSDADLASVGVAGNTVVSKDTGAPTTTGVFLGSSDIEGFQAGVMLTALDNDAVDWLTTRTTTDGVALTGFANLNAALAYDSTAPLRWFPAEVSVVETVDADCAFPRPSGYSVRSGGSHLLDLAGVLGAYASVFALTDHANTSVGGSQSVRAYFDGDPFADDDQLANGEPSLHDRSLAMMRVSLVDLIRMHVDPASGVPVDDVTIAAGAPVRGATLTTATAAYTLLALRTTRRALSDQLALYSNTTPDTAVVATPIDAPPIATGPTTVTATTALNSLIRSISTLIFEHLTDATGRAWSGWDVGKGAHASEDDSLDAHTAAVRGLFVAYLSTGDVKYRNRAVAVFERVESTFYDPSARVYRSTAGDRSNSVTFTPLRFALVQAMLRDVYELVASLDPDKTRATLILDRVARLNTLVLNGWDDRNGDQKVDWPQECVQTIDGLPRGGLQMAERTLSGETGTAQDKLDAGVRTIATDREHDCVPELSAVKLPSALADSITFTIASPRK